MTAKALSTHVISITPFDGDGRLDEGAVRAHFDRMADGGVGVYVGGGGSGEGFTLSGAERRRVLELAVERLRGRVPVRAMGTEPRTAAEMVDYITMAADVGVEATQIYSLDQGHGHRPTEAEIETYLRDILERIELPAVLSSHQSVGYLIPIGLVQKLAADHPTIIGVNVSTGDHRYLTAMVDAVGDQMEIHVGGPTSGLLAIAVGANGYLSSEANLAPHLCQRVITAARDGDLPAMMDAFGRVVRLSSALYGAGGIRATKAVLGRLGLPGGVPRRPQLPVSSAVVDQLLAVAGELDLAAFEGWERPAGAAVGRGERRSPVGARSEAVATLGQGSMDVRHTGARPVRTEALA